MKTAKNIHVQTFARTPPGKGCLHQIAGLCFTLCTDQMFLNSSEIFTYAFLMSFITLDFTFSAMVQFELDFIYSKMYV